MFTSGLCTSLTFAGVEPDRVLEMEPAAGRGLRTLWGILLHVLCCGLAVDCTGRQPGLCAGLDWKRSVYFGQPQYADRRADGLLPSHAVCVEVWRNGFACSIKCPKCTAGDFAFRWSLRGLWFGLRSPEREAPMRTLLCAFSQVLWIRNSSFRIVSS